MAKERKLHKQHTKASNAVAHIVLVLISIIWLIPFVCVVLQSFRSFELEKGGDGRLSAPEAFFTGFLQVAVQRGKPVLPLVWQYTDYCIVCCNRPDHHGAYGKLCAFKNAF